NLRLGTLKFQFFRIRANCSAEIVPGFYTPNLNPIRPTTGKQAPGEELQFLVPIFSCCDVSLQCSCVKDTLRAAGGKKQETRKREKERVKEKVHSLFLPLILSIILVSSSCPPAAARGCSAQLVGARPGKQIFRSYSLHIMQAE